MSHSVSTGLLILRLVILVIMSFHGTQKLFGWWDGGGLDRAERFFAGQGFRPPRLMAAIAGVTELTGALLVGAGLLTVLGVAMLTGLLTNVTAIHVRNGLDSRKHGFELELMILAGVVAVGLSGAGQWSLDQWFAVPGRSWLGAVAIGFGLVAGLVVAATRDRVPSGQPSGQTVPPAGV
jgi:putative oxidoreductase